MFPCTFVMDSEAGFIIISFLFVCLFVCSSSLPSLFASHQDYDIFLSSLVTRNRASAQTPSLNFGPKME